MVLLLHWNNSLVCFNIGVGHQWNKNKSVTGGGDSYAGKMLCRNVIRERTLWPFWGHFLSMLHGKSFLSSFKSSRFLVRTLNWINVQKSVDEESGEKVKLFNSTKTNISVFVVWITKITQLVIAWTVMDILHHGVYWCERHRPLFQSSLCHWRVISLYLSAPASPGQWWRQPLIVFRELASAPSLPQPPATHAHPAHTSIWPTEELREVCVFSDTLVFIW